MQEDKLSVVTTVILKLVSSGLEMYKYLNFSGNSLKGLNYTHGSKPEPCLKVLYWSLVYRVTLVELS